MKASGEAGRRLLDGRSVSDVILVFCKDIAVAEDAAAHALARRGHQGESVARISEEDLAGQSDRIEQILGGASLFGPTQALWLKCDGDPKAGNLKLIEAMMDRAGTLEAPVLISAGDLAKRSRLRQIAEAHKIATAVQLYPDRQNELARLLAETSEGAGVRLSGPASELLAAAWLGDRRSALNELEKLILYVGPTGEITPAALAEFGGGGGSDDLSDVVDLFFKGDTANWYRTYDRFIDTGGAPTSLLRGLLRKVHQLVAVAGARDSGTSAVRLAQAGQVHLQEWMLEDLGRLARDWRMPRLLRLWGDLYALERFARHAGSCEAGFLRAELGKRLSRPGSDRAAAG